MGRDVIKRLIRVIIGVSIHAPRVGRDIGDLSDAIAALVSIHAPRVGRDTPFLVLDDLGSGFQSTRPVWGATSEIFGRTLAIRFNPRAPCGARHFVGAAYSQGFSFNPRAPCGARHSDALSKMSKSVFQSTRPVWGATFRNVSTVEWMAFQSTRPVWGATSIHSCSSVINKVSIHAPRVGRDPISAFRSSPR